MLANLGHKIDDILKENGHSRDEIVCVLWGDPYNCTNSETALSIDVESFWEYADCTEWDDDEWASGPHYPLWILSADEWWLEATEYDCRTNVKFVTKPKLKKTIIKITELGSFRELEVDK